MSQFAYSTIGLHRRIGVDCPRLTLSMTFIQGIGSRDTILDEDDVAFGQVHISDLILGIVYHGLRGVEIIIAIIVKCLETICGNPLIGDGVIPFRW